MLHNTPVVFLDQNIWSSIVKDTQVKDIILDKQSIGKILLTIYPTNLFETQQIQANTSLKDNLIDVFKSVKIETPHFYTIFKDEVERLVNNKAFLNHYIHEIEDVPFVHGKVELVGGTIEQQNELDEFMKNLTPFFYDVMFCKNTTSSFADSTRSTVLTEMQNDKDLFLSLKKPNDKKHKNFVILYFKNLCQNLDIRYFDGCDDNQIYDVAMQIPSYSVHIKLKCDLYNNSTGPIDRNDFIDIFFLSAVIPYCDIAVIEKKWCNVCKNLKFEQDYNVKLFSNTKELLKYIN